MTNNLQEPDALTSLSNLANHRVVIRAGDVNHRNWAGHRRSDRLRDFLGAALQGLEVSQAPFLELPAFR